MAKAVKKTVKSASKSTSPKKPLKPAKKSTPKGSDKSPKKKVSVKTSSKPVKKSAPIKPKSAPKKAAIKTTKKNVKARPVPVKKSVKVPAKQVKSAKIPVKPVKKAEVKKTLKSRPVAAKKSVVKKSSERQLSKKKPVTIKAKVASKTNIKPAKATIKANTKVKEKPLAKTIIKSTPGKAAKIQPKKDQKPIIKNEEKPAVKKEVKKEEKIKAKEEVKQDAKGKKDEKKGGKNENVEQTPEESTPVVIKTSAKNKTEKEEIDLGGDVSIERKLVSLFNLQQVDTEINKIRIVRGELPLEVQDLEDEIAGLETRIDNYKAELEQLEASVKEKKAAQKECVAMIKKYEVQQNNVRNNREFDSLSKEIEFQNLEIQLCEKRIKEFTAQAESKKAAIASAKELLDERLEDLKQKKIELEEIVAETEKEESRLLKKFQENQKFIEERLLTAYQRIKKNAKNGLAVVSVERDACGGCFNKIPPQKQLDIKMHKKIIVCEYCGRILVDKSIEEMASQQK